jgi:hypothetical protein
MTMSQKTAISPKYVRGKMTIHQKDTKFPVVSFLPLQQDTVLHLRNFVSPEIDQKYTEKEYTNYQALVIIPWKLPYLETPYLQVDYTEPHLHADINDSLKKSKESHLADEFTNIAKVEEIYIPALNAPSKDYLYISLNHITTHKVPDALTSRNWEYSCRNIIWILSASKIVEKPGLIKCITDDKITGMPCYGYKEYPTITSTISQPYLYADFSDRQARLLKSMIPTFSLNGCKIDPITQARTQVSTGTKSDLYPFLPDSAYTELQSQAIVPKKGNVGEFYKPLRIYQSAHHPPYTKNAIFPTVIVKNDPEPTPEPIPDPADPTDPSNPPDSTITDSSDSSTAKTDTNQN